MLKPSRQKMCLINPIIVPLIAPLVGGQSEIMVRVGISWNSWNKILDGQPIRVSMAERFRTRIISLASELDSFASLYPAAGGGLDHAALEADFVKPALAGDDRPVHAVMPQVSAREMASAAF